MLCSGAIKLRYLKIPVTSYHLQISEGQPERSLEAVQITARPTNRK
jgi:hypothetical protein